MGWRDTYGGNFLKASDLPKPKKVKLGDISEEVIAKGERPKLIVDLPSMGKRWPLNTSNCELLEEITGSDEPDDWEGWPVVVFNDTTVRGPNGEKGGVRCRAATKKKQPDPEPEVDDDDDLDEMDD